MPQPVLSRTSFARRTQPPLPSGRIVKENSINAKKRQGPAGKTTTATSCAGERREKVVEIFTLHPGLRPSENRTALWLRNLKRAVIYYLGWAQKVPEQTLERKGCRSSETELAPRYGGAERRLARTLARHQVYTQRIV